MGVDGSEAVFNWLDNPHEVWNAEKGNGKISLDEWVKGQLAAYPESLYSAAEVANEIDSLVNKVKAAKK